MQKKIKTIQHTFSYWEFGDQRQPTILCLPGYTNQAKMFSQLGQYLFGKYHLIALDFPMLYEKKAICDLQLLTDYVADFVNQFSWSNFTLAGFSIGGLVAINYSYFYSKRVKSLYLLNSFPRILISELGLVSYRLIKPILVSKTFCRLCLLNASSKINRLTGWNRIKEDSLNLMKKHPKTVFGTLFNLADSQLTNKFNLLPFKKTIVLFKDDRLLNWRKYSRLATAFSWQTVVFNRGGHGEKTGYWENIKSLWLKHNEENNFFQNIS